MDFLFGKRKFLEKEVEIQEGLELPPIGKRQKEIAPSPNGIQFESEVKLLVTPVYAALYPAKSIPKNVYQVLRYHEKKLEYTKRFRSGKWDGTLSLGKMVNENGKLEYVFPLGLLPKVVEACNAVGVRVREDRCVRHRPVQQINPMEEGVLHGGIELRDYQREMVNAFVDLDQYEKVHALRSVKMVDKEKAKDLYSEVGELTRYRVPGNGLIWSATGSGKTVAAASIIGRLGVKTLFMVYGNDLVRQTWKSLQHFIGAHLANYGESVGICSEGEFSPQFVTVAGSSTMAAMLCGPERTIGDVKSAVRKVTSLTDSAVAHVREGKEGNADKVILRNIRLKMAKWLSAMPTEREKARAIYMELESLDFEGIVFPSGFVVETSEDEDSVSHAEWLSLLWKAFRAMESFFEKFDNAMERKQKLLDYLAEVDLLIVDEVHGAAASGAYSVVQNCPAYYRIGLSGTPLDRSDGANLKIIGAFGEVASRITNSQMREAGVIPDATIKMVSVPGHIKMKRGFKWNELYTKGIVEHEWRNRYACKEVKKVYECGGSVLMLFQSIEHGKILSELLDEYGVEYVCLDGKSKSDERQNALARFTEGILKVLVASRIFNTGIDIPTGMDLLVNVSGGKGRVGKERGGILVLQALGRSLRGGAQHSVKVLDFMDEHNSTLHKHSCSRKRIFEEQGCFDVEEERVGFANVLVGDFLK